LCIEAAEVLELFQWSDQVPESTALASELADVTLYLLQLARVTGIDLEGAVMDKLKINYQREWDVNPQAERINMSKKISVFGGSAPKPGSPAYQEAYELGQLLGGAGMTVLTGGYTRAPWKPPHVAPAKPAGM
jgi:hypothetical protein